MVEITFLEVHLDGAEFTANAPGSGGFSDEDGATDETGLGSGESDTGGGSSPLPSLLAFVGLVVAVVVVRRLLGGSGEPALE
ncbi:hypothetical protein [Halosimplex sp. J119]